MRTLTRLGACAAAMTVVITPAATFEMVKAAADGRHRVGLESDLRRCDFSLVSTAPPVARPDSGAAQPDTTAGSRAVAEVDLVDPPTPVPISTSA